MTLLAACAEEGSGPSAAESAGSGRCPARGDHTFDVDLAGASVEVTDSGAQVEWSLRVAPGASISRLSPGESVAVTLRFGDGELFLVRDGRALYASAVFDAPGTTFAQGELPSEVGWIGARDLGPWQSSLSTNAGGAPIRVRLGAIGVNPNAEDNYGCVALRGTVPASVSRVDDSEPLAVTASGDLTLGEVRVSLTGDAPLEPYALELR